MVKHNNAIPNVHLRKHWDRGVGAKTHFNQPAQKIKRNKNRIAKAKRMFPRPVNSLRPIVSQATRKYAGKFRYGRGFTLAELRAAKLTDREARTIGIAVDHRRTSTSEEQLQMNVERLNTYKNKLVILSGRNKKNAPAATSQVTGVVLPRAHVAPALEWAKIEDKDRKSKVFHALRSARTNTRYRGRRLRKAEEAKANEK
jgi:large subunit ribosomal protein L13e